MSRRRCHRESPRGHMIGAAMPPCLVPTRHRQEPTRLGIGSRPLLRAPVVRLSRLRRRPRRRPRRQTPTCRRLARSRRVSTPLSWDRACLISRWPDKEHRRRGPPTGHRCGLGMDHCPHRLQRRRLRRREVRWPNSWLHKRRLPRPRQDQFLARLSHVARLSTRRPR